MSKITAEEQVAFLLSCIRFSNNGKIDFAGVAQECSIITAAAAAKRYSRLLKSAETGSAGASPSKKTGDNDASAAPPEKKGAGAKRKAAGPKNAPSKKAKVMKKTAVAVAEGLVEKKLGPVKKEEDSELSDAAASDEDDQDVKEKTEEEEE